MELSWILKKTAMQHFRPFIKFLNYKILITKHDMKHEGEDLCHETLYIAI